MKMLAAVAFALAGCVTMPQSMSPEQMAQNVKDKNAVVGCVYGVGLYGQGGAVYVDTNKIAPNQTVNVDSQCKVNVTGSTSPKTP